MNSEFSSYRIIDLLESRASSFVYGEIKNFSSTYKPASGTNPAQKNGDVECFLKKKAESFSRQNLSMTHLVLSSVSQELLGYFSLTVKYSPTWEKLFKSCSSSHKRRCVTGCLYGEG